ncbi:MAG: rubrerythrin family protein [Spirochaetaceae bacterium]|jgi:rubrerythrin|nr:rubrerythrin family protein [Spirochaetaceae bacterium]
MANLKGSKTEENLKAAFNGESLARGKYVYFAAKAREEGYTQVAQIFDEFSLNEQEHAKIWFKLLDGIGNTSDNLKTAIDGERSETGEMYPNFARKAREEGFGDIAKLFEQVAGIEKGHAKQFENLLANLKKDGEGASGVWKCKNCGNTISANNAPPSCPVCGNSDIAWSGYKAFAFFQN